MVIATKLAMFTAGLVLAWSPAGGWATSSVPCSP